MPALTRAPDAGDPLIRAAAYVRMSTEHQQYSTSNQMDVIEEYAEKHGMTIVRTYSDEGKSGLGIQWRGSLQQMIADVQDRTRDYDAILVYDVSRWGRFQDADESGYYEFQCRKAGVHVHYCAEQFVNDGSPTANIIKSVKRSMAGEYSRELSVKVFKGQCTLIERGFRQGGHAGFGLRRALIDERREFKGVLGIGEQKSIQTDRVILVPGPLEEIAVVQQMYRWFVEDRLRELDIAERLNGMGLHTDFGRPWTRGTVHQVLTNEKYIGHNVYNRQSYKLKKVRVINPPEMYVRADGAFEAIIDPMLYARVQDILAGRARRYSDDELLAFLSTLWKSTGRLTFISVTQSFCTTTSMGRLTLNMLLSFAQFEREVIGERIRDKVAASKQRGMYMGGTPPLGYDVVNKKLAVNPPEAELVREIFQRFAHEGSTTRLAQALNAEGKTTKAWTTKEGKVRAGTPWHKGHIYKLLHNRLYLGLVEHKGNCYPGEHTPIVSHDAWDRAHALLSENYRVRANRTRAKVPGLLKGLIRCGHCGTAMGITYTKKKGSTTHYRYYLCTRAAKSGYAECPVKTVAAGEIETAAVALIRKSLATPEVAARTYREARGLAPDLVDEQAIATHLRQFTALWDELFPAEQARLLQLLVGQIVIHPDGVQMALRADGLHALLDEWRGTGQAVEAEEAAR
jgi:DNA invertase Pin-like site-specific DNA recombinase